MERQEYFQGLKIASGKGWQPYHIQMPLVSNSGNLSLLELSGPVQACTRFVLLLPLQYDVVLRISFSLLLLISKKSQNSPKIYGPDFELCELWLVKIFLKNSLVKSTIAFKENYGRQGRETFTTTILLNVLNHNINSGRESEK